MVKKHRFIINAVMALLKPMEDVFREALTEIERRGAHRNPQQVFEQVKREIIEQRVTLLAIIDKHKLLASKSAAESTAALFTVDFREGYGTDKICRISFGWVRRGKRRRGGWRRGGCGWFNRDRRKARNNHESKARGSNGGGGAARGAAAGGVGV